MRYQKKKKEEPVAPPVVAGFRNEEAFPKLGVESEEREFNPMPPVYQTKSLFNFSSPVLNAQLS